MNLTIIIHTIDYRNSMVSRSIEYYRNLRVNLIIVDGSKKSYDYNLIKKEKYFHLNEKNFISLRYLTIDPPKKFISALSNNNNDVDLLSTSNHKIIGTVFKSILQTYSRD